MGLATIPRHGAIASQTGGTVTVGADAPVSFYRVSSGTSAIRVSVILPAIDESASLRKTVDILLAENASDLAEILIITCRKTSQAALWVKKIEWEAQRHAFLLETILKPMRLWARVAELPTIWRNRTERISHHRLLQHFAYFRIGFKTRFRSPQALLARTHS
jgi:hypothetical protein